MEKIANYLQGVPDGITFKDGMFVVKEETQINNNSSPLLIVNKPDPKTFMGRDQEPLYPVNVHEEKEAEESELEKLQRQMDATDQLLPTSLNGQIFERKYAEDNEDDNTLIPPNII
jgi:hypothetical protein